LIPQALADKFVSGYQLTEGTDYGSGVRCTYKAPGKADNLAVTFRCDGMAAAAKLEIDEAKKKGTFVDVGRGGAKVAGALHVLDDDTDCFIAIGGYNSAVATDPLPFAKELVAAITPAVIER
jgi:hypothetical protein